MILRGHEPEDNPSTPRWLSPLEDGVLPRQGVDLKDIPQPQGNRKSRRASGFFRPRNRLGGVSIADKPWSVK